jgi:hypothetical protein
MVRGSRYSRLTWFDIGFYVCFPVLGIEPRAVCILDKHFLLSYNPGWLEVFMVTREKA